MKWFSGLSFKARVFLGCLLVALVPLTFSSVVMTRLFTVSVRGRPADGGNKPAADTAFGKL